MNDKHTRIVHDNWDITGMEARRMLKQYALWKPFRYGWIAEGPGWRKLFELLFRHHFGYWLGYVALRYERQWTWLRTLPARVKRRLRR